MNLQRGERKRARACNRGRRADLDKLPVYEVFNMNGPSNFAGSVRGVFIDGPCVGCGPMTDS